MAATRMWLVPLALSLACSGAIAQADGVFKDRAKRIDALQRSRPAAAKAVKAGLAYLAAAQKPDGHWESEGSRTSATALAVLAHLGAHSNLREGAHAERVRLGLQWLEGEQSASGWIGDPRSGLGAYEHALATIALIEAYAVAPSPRRRVAAQAALRALAAHGNRDGGWGFTAWQSHTSVVGLVAVALRSARDVGLAIPDAAKLDQVHEWLVEVTDAKTGVSRATSRGSDAYVPWHPATSQGAMTASVILGRTMLWRRTTHEGLRPSADFVVSEAPLWQPGRADLDAWFVASHALWQVGGRHWQQWVLGLDATLTASQRTDGAVRGSWDPVGLTGANGQLERARATALATLALLGSCRYARVTDEETAAAPVVDRETTPPARGGRNTAVGIGGGAGGKFGGRGRGRAALARKGGKATANAIQRGLEWLAKHQDPDGRFSAAEYSAHCPEDAICIGAGKAFNDIGVTGLALLAFLGDGSTLRSGPYKRVVKRATLWLKNQQGEDGVIGSPTHRAFAYNHAIATLALVEAYGLSSYKVLKQPAQRAVDYIAKARNPYKAWRYYPRDGDNDTSVTTWMVFALKAAQDFNLQVDPNALRFALSWFDEVTDPKTGKCGYTKRGEGSSREIGTAEKFPSSKTEALTAAGLLSRFFLGQVPAETPLMTAAADTLLASPPAWNEVDGSIDLYYWFYGTYAMYQMGGRYWSQWRKSLEPALVRTQADAGHALGSWKPQSAWSGEGGRVYATAMSVLTLEAYYRYTRLVR